MERIINKLAVLIAAFALLLPGTLIVMSASEASAAPTYGRVTVSGANILVDGSIPSQKFFGVVETTALQFAILTYVEGQSGLAGKTSTFNGPDTSEQGYIPQNANAEQFWHQYFALCAYYKVNLVRLGAGDSWGSEIEYQAWLNHHDAYISFLKTMCAQAEQHGVWICFVLAGSQEYPTYQYGGSGSVFDPSSTAFKRYTTYCRDVMSALDGENGIAMYDLFNEPDHNNCNLNYWHNDKVKFNTWAKAVASATAGASSHPRTMGVAGLGGLFGWGKADFDLATGNTGFEILHRHYYASATGSSNTYLFADPESWARQDGKPLFWGELGYNAVYPLTRYSFGEQAIYANGGQAITSMVLTGTVGYPYKGGTLPDPAAGPVPLPELKYTSSPRSNGTVGEAYSYQATTSIACTYSLSTDAGFLTVDPSTGVVSGVPSAAGSYAVRLSATSSDHRTIYQNYSLSIAAPYVPPPPADDGNGTTGGGTGTGSDGGSTGGNTTSGGGTADNGTADSNKTNNGRSAYHRHAHRYVIEGEGTTYSSSTEQAPTSTTEVRTSVQAPISSGYISGSASEITLALCFALAAVAAVGILAVISRARK